MFQRLLGRQAVLWHERPKRLNKVKSKGIHAASFPLVVFGPRDAAKAVGLRGEGDALRQHAVHHLAHGPHVGGLIVDRDVAPGLVALQLGRHVAGRALDAGHRLAGGVDALADAKVAYLDPPGVVWWL